MHVTTLSTTTTFCLQDYFFPPKKVNFLSLTTTGFGRGTPLPPHLHPEHPMGLGGACVAPLPSQEARAPFPFAQMAAGR